MRAFPHYTPKHELVWLSQESRLAAVTRFLNTWEPVLKNNGFTRTGSSWYRVHGGQILQGIDFNPKPRNKYAKNLEIKYVLWPMFTESCGFPPWPFLHLQQHLVDYRYPSYIPSPHHCRWQTVDMDDNGVLMPGPVLETSPFDYISFYYALRDVEAALDAELELFCEKTLPMLDEISDPISYADKDMEIRKRELPKEHCVGLSPAGVDILMAQKEWWLSEKSLRICLRQEERIGMTQTDRKWIYDWYYCALQHVLSRDEEWITKHFQKNLANNWEILRKWNPKIFEAQAR